MNDFSWGKFPEQQSNKKVFVHWPHELTSIVKQKNVLPYGLGRSYGDSCLPTSQGTLLKNRLDKMIHFDSASGVLTCQSGVSLDQILRFAVPKGYFLPVTPGTKFVTVGGAVANDVHGKNHHAMGTFGCHVTSLNLLRSDGEEIQCSLDQNKELFQATIGGLGLTGFITQLSFKLMPIHSSYFTVDAIQFNTFDEFFEINQDSVNDYPYTVAWVDSLSSDVRGVYLRGKNSSETRDFTIHQNKSITIPFDFPSFTLNKWTVGAFNTLYFHKQIKKQVRLNQHYDPFFYPLDGVNLWNRIYGKSGFLQYQCVLPFDGGRETAKKIFRLAAQSKKASFLTVLKTFGENNSPGMLSFPMEGITICLDFAYSGRDTLTLLDEFDDLTLETGGRVYPAKDARMTSDSFKQFYPNWKDFKNLVDPNFDSAFWRRVS